MVGVVRVECGRLDCGEYKRVSEFDIGYDPTKQKDTYLKKLFFEKWVIKGVNGGKRTRCPKHRNDPRPTQTGEK